MLYPGLYEQVINNALNSELAKIPEARKSTAPIDTAEAAKVLAQYLTDVVQKGLENVQDNGGGIEAQIQLANQIVTTIRTLRVRHHSNRHSSASTVRESCPNPHPIPTAV